MDWLDRISITCFAASYLLVFAFEVSRVFFKVRYRKYLIVGLTAAGLFAHTVFLALQTQFELSTTGVWLGSWSGWCLAAAWFLVASYMWVSIRKSHAVIGLFLIPMVMSLIAMGSRGQMHRPFSNSQAKSVWSMVHGSALLLGTVVVTLGFSFGMMYLYQAHRLKKKIPQSERFKLPSLEWLQRTSERALLSSVFFLGVGLISGLVINVINAKFENASALPWSDPVVWSSAILFTWLSAASLFSLVYRPARQGRKVAYLIVASFLFLILELGIVWWAGHGQAVNATALLVDSSLSFVGEWGGAA